MITVLRFKDFQGPFTSNSKTFKDLFHFQRLSRPWKNEHFFKDFQELSRPCGHPDVYNITNIFVLPWPAAVQFSSAS